VEQPYTYTGREFDGESGLLYYRARYYDSLTGRFLQKDPIGLAGGDTTLYGYAFRSPVNLGDSFGLNPLAGAIVGGAIAGPPGAVVGALVTLGVGIVGSFAVNEIIHSQGDIIDFDAEKRKRQRAGATVGTGDPNCPDDPLCRLVNETKLSEVRWRDPDHDGRPIPGLYRRQCEYQCGNGIRYSVQLTNRLGCPKTDIFNPGRNR
jgi:RHS repeat-associated protein